jgi:streptogrisin C
VFSGTTAFGIVKGASYRRDGSCAFYFYMSLDYLPAPWSLLLDTAAVPSRPGSVIGRGTPEAPEVRP